MGREQRPRLLMCMSALLFLVAACGGGNQGRLSVTASSDTPSETSSPTVPDEVDTPVGAEASSENRWWCPPAGWEEARSWTLPSEDGARGDPLLIGAHKGTVGQFKAWQTRRVPTTEPGLPPVDHAPQPLLDGRASSGTAAVCEFQAEAFSTPWEDEPHRFITVVVVGDGSAELYTAGAERLGPESRVPENASALRDRDGWG